MWAALLGFVVRGGLVMSVGSLRVEVRGVDVRWKGGRDWISGVGVDVSMECCWRDGGVVNWVV